MQVAAKACFEALNAANEAHQMSGRGVEAMVAGFDDADEGAQVYEFTVPDTSGGPRPSAGFSQDRFLAIPTYNETSDRVRAVFGLLTTDQYLDRLDELADDPAADFRGQFSLADQDLHSMQAAVREVLPSFLATDVARLDQEGIGGRWVTYSIRPGRDVVKKAHVWGPMRAAAGDVPIP